MVFIGRFDHICSFTLFGLYQIVWVDPQISNINYSQIYIPQNVEKETFEIDWNLVSLIIYAIGFLAFMIKFTFDFYSLNSILKNKKYTNKLILNSLI